MDIETERQLLDRVKILEEQVGRMAREVKPADTIETTANKIVELVDRIHPISLTRVLQEIPKGHWARTFYGLPKRVMEKLKSSVSKNSWKELIEDWTISRYGLGSQLDQEQFMRVALQLENMGVIVLDSIAGSEPELFEEAGATAPFDIDTYRARRAEADRKAAAGNRPLDDRGTIRFDLRSWRSHTG